MASSRFSERDLERMLSGSSAARDDDPSLAAFLDEVKVVYTSAPSEKARSRHLSAISRQAVLQGQALPAKTPPAGAAARRTAGTRRFGHRIKLVSLGALLALALPLATAGLATAGVGLPAFLQAPFKALGIDLPNQSSAPEVNAVIDEVPPEQRGCAFGWGLAALAGDEATRANRPCSRAAQSGEARGGDNRRSRGGDHPSNSRDTARSGAGRSFGSATGADAQAETASGQRSFGERTADGGRAVASPPARSGGPSGDPPADDRGSRFDERGAGVDSRPSPPSRGEGAPATGRSGAARGGRTAEGHSEDGRPAGGSRAEVYRP